MLDAALARLGMAALTVTVPGLAQLAEQAARGELDDNETALVQAQVDRLAGLLSQINVPGPKL